MMKSLYISVIAFYLTAFLVFLSPAFAQLVVVPNSLENTEGETGSAFPFSCGQTRTSMRYQQVYLGSQFGVAVLIDKISFRLQNFDSLQPGFGPTTVPNVLIELSTTQAQPNALSSTFALNIGPDVQTVFSGGLSLSAPDCNTKPCPFDVMILLENPFFYNPEDGNLLFDIRIPVCVRLNPDVGVFFDSTSSFPTIISRAFSSNVGSDTADDVLPSGLVTQFRIIEPPPAQVPTLSEWGLIAMAGILGIVGFIVIRRKKITA